MYCESLSAGCGPLLQAANIPSDNNKMHSNPIVVFFIYTSPPSRDYFTIEMEIPKQKGDVSGAPHSILQSKTRLFYLEVLPTT